MAVITVYEVAEKHSVGWRKRYVGTQEEAWAMFRTVRTGEVARWRWKRWVPKADLLDMLNKRTVLAPEVTVLARKANGLLVTEVGNV